MTDYAASTGTLTVAGANLSDDSSNLATCELSRFNSDEVENHFNRAAKALFPFVARVRNIETIVTGQKQHRFTLPNTLRGKPERVYIGDRVTAANVATNEITDPGFEDWASATSLTSWSLSGTGSAVNQQAQTSDPTDYTVLEGSNSARLVSNTSDATSLLQAVTPSIATERVRAHLSVWVYNTQTTDSVVARLISSSSAAHGGTGWERLTASANIGEATTVSVGVSVATATSAAFSVYVDEIVLTIGQSEPVDEPWTEVENWVWTPSGGASDNGFIEFDSVLPMHRRLRIQGRDYLTSIASDTSEIEVGGEVFIPLYDYTRMLMSEEAASVSFSGGRDYWLGRAREFEASWQRELDRGNYVHQPVRRPRLPIP